LAQNGQYFLFPLWLFEDYEWSGLSLSAKAIMPVLFRHANRDGEAWPSQTTIGIEAGIKSRRIIGKAARELSGAGYISLGKKSKPKSAPLNVYRRELSIDHRELGSQSFTPFHYQIIDSGAWGACTLSAKALYPVLRWRGRLYGDDDADSGGGWINEDDLLDHLQGRKWDIVRRANYKSMADLALWSGIDRRSMGSALESLWAQGLVQHLPEVKGAFKVMLIACPPHGGNK